ncbi:MAG: helix-turn-helix transcriptional regulator [Candidatus Saganbacteria bacterium]|nr:helix-turn-helix transcriptional regulator [Candidatus Saganbacteria bacterium]
MVNKNRCCKIDLDPIAKVLRIISEPSRLKILCLLKKKELCVCEIQEELKQKHNLVCHHLKSLVKVKLLDSRKENGFTYYKLNRLNYNRTIKDIYKLLGGGGSV